MNLVIMAAGMGSRFGGLKQIEPIDKNKNFIIELKKLTINFMLNLLYGIFDIPL